MLKQLIRVSLSAILASALMSAPAFAGLVNINTASAAALAHHLSGVGAKKAQAIVEYRKANGKFSSIEGITEVKGIGKGLLKKNRESLSLNKGAVAMSKTGKKTPVVISRKTNLKAKLPKTVTAKKPKVVRRSLDKVASAKKLTTKSKSPSSK